MKTLTRRDFLLAAGIGVTFSCTSSLTRSAQTTDRPNLLIIQTDEHNFRTLGCYRKTLPPEQAFMWGQDSVVETPNIDWIADHGALCTKFYATTPVCSPSHASFMSGRYPQNTPVVTNNIAMSDDVVTFAEILRRTGYATGYAGKWHLDGPGRPQWAPPRKFGFEDNRYMFNRGHWKQLEDMPQGPRVKARKGKTPTYDVKGADSKSFTTDWLTDKTLEFIKTHRDKPFCYMVSIPDPHGPDTVRAPYDTQYNGMTFIKPRTFDKSTANVPSWAKPQGGGYGQSQYYGMVKCIDDNVGRILNCLQEAKLMEHTIVVFTSDHGDLRCEHHRQNKGVPLEASAKVPFVIHYPPKIKAGTLVTQALGTVDFLPTLLSLMDVATAGREEGRDAADLFTQGRRSEGWKDITFVRGTGGADANWLAAFTSRYKLIVSPEDKPWLIDMVQDPDELRNFCFDSECRDIVRDLARELTAYGKQYNDPRTVDHKIGADLQWCIEGTGQYISMS